MSEDLVSGIPRELLRRNRSNPGVIGALISVALVSELMDGLPFEITSENFSQVELEVLALAHAAAKEDKSLGQTLDDIIITEARSMGWRMETSKVVHWRHMTWARCGIAGAELFRRWGEALATSVLRGFDQDEPIPLEDFLWAHKEQTKQELQAVVQLLRGKLAQQQRTPTRAMLARRWEDVIDAGDFPHLKANKDSWLAFFEYDQSLPLQEQSNNLRDLLVGKNRVNVAALYDDWTGWRCHIKPEWARQKICKLRPQ